MMVTGFTFLFMVVYVFVREHFRGPQSPDERDRLERLKAALEPWREDLRRLTGRRAGSPPPGV